MNPNQINVADMRKAPLGEMTAAFIVEQDGTLSNAGSALCLNLARKREA
jgi:hypothetical protein